MRLTIAVAAAVLVAGTAQAQDRDRPRIAIAPVALELEGDWTAGVRLDFAAGSRRHQVASAFPRSSYWRAEGRGALALDEDLNPDPILVAAAGGLSIASSNTTRTEDLETALAIDRRLREVWSRHARVAFVPHERDFGQKVCRGVAALRSLLSG